MVQAGASSYSGFIGVVYGFRLESSAEFRYVGLTTTSIRRRTLQHFRNAAAGRKTPFYDWLRTAPGSFIFVESLEVVTTTAEDLGEAEMKWIKRFRERGDRLLNIADGGLGPTGVIWSPAQREAARVRATGRPGLSRPGPENPFFGYRHSDDLRARWSEARRGLNAGERNQNFGKFGPEHPSFGHTISEETRALLSSQKLGERNPNFGKVTSAETRAKLSAALKGRPMPSSARSAHTRWHSNKGIQNLACRFCVENSSNMAETPSLKAKEKE